MYPKALRFFEVGCVGGGNSERDAPLEPAFLSIAKAAKRPPAHTLLNLYRLGKKGAAMLQKIKARKTDGRRFQ
jgi:hypothetical protein